MPDTRRTPEAPGFAPATSIASPHATARPTDTLGPTGPTGPTTAHRALQRSGTILLGAVLLAQAVFLAYLAASYGRAALAGDVAAWAGFSAKGWVAGDPAGNTAMALHLVVAGLMLVAGAVQLAPQVRRTRPALHRWSGRVYLTGGMLGAASGLALVWGRGTVGDLSQHVAISINAALLIGCAIMAWRTARVRDVGAHRMWALRTFVVAGGVLYFRLLLAFWLLVFRAPVGFEPKTFSGPFLTVLALTAYVFGPLLLLEAYHRARLNARRTVRWATSGLLAGIAGLVLLGTVAAALVLWLPRVR